jgi:hypothetical protein
MLKGNYDPLERAAHGGVTSADEELAPRRGQYPNHTGLHWTRVTRRAGELLLRSSGTGNLVPVVRWLGDSDGYGR